MNDDVRQILSQIEGGDSSAAEQLLPLVYDELRKLAAAKLAQEKPGQTLQATALVHEAYLRLVDGDSVQQWNGRGHFFAAAAEAMAGTAGAPNVDAAGSIFTETQTLVKYEIMDGAPVKGEVIPVKLSLEGIPADLTPTYVGLSRFSVRYFLNLVLVDEDDRRYFKQQEIVLWRKELG